MKKLLKVAIAASLLFPSPLFASENNYERPIYCDVSGICSNKENILQYISENKKNPYSLVSEAFKSHDIVFLGESHDQSSHRYFAANLIKTLEGKIDAVALEIVPSQKIEKELELFMQNKENRLKWVLPSTMISDAYMEIFNSIRNVRQNNKLDILFIDDNTDLKKRDVMMASSIFDYLQEHKKAKILVYTGGMHARKIPAGLPFSIYSHLSEFGIERDRMFSVEQETYTKRYSFGSLTKFYGSNSEFKEMFALETSGLENFYFGFGSLKSSYPFTFDAVILHPY